jgi:hypothetical protein
VEKSDLRGLWWVEMDSWILLVIDGKLPCIFGFSVGKLYGFGCEIVVPMWSFGAKSWAERGA